jgi:serine/threonine-protein kinase
MYVVEQKVASGGMASVYRGYDPSLDRPVAIKVLRPELATARGAERFLREARHLAHVSHPNVVAIHEVGEAAGLFFYVMDFLAAPTLAELLESGPLSQDQSIRVAVDLLKALEAVHTAGLVHRDVKPANVFVTDDRVLLGDFGIAKTLDAKGAEPLTTDGQVVGTPGYMAPEQDVGDEVTPRSDLYAAGLVLFQCLSGIAFGEVDTLPGDVTWSRVPTELRRPIERALAPDPADRWPDAGAFREALEAAAPPSGAAATAPSFARRRWPLVLVLLAAASAALGIAFSRMGGPEAIEMFAWLPCDDLSAEGDQAYVADNLAEEMSNRLSTIPGLTGVPRPTASAIKQLGMNPEEIGDYINVGAVVECTVLREGDSIEVDVRLSDTRTGDTLLVERYEGAWPEVFAIQQEITGDVAAALPGIEAPTTAPLTLPNLEAYDLYLLGRHRWRERTGPALSQAEEWFWSAIEADPTYAPAHAGLADVYVVLTARGLRGVFPDSAFRVARQHAEDAIRLDSTLAAPFAALAEAKRAYFWEDWVEAEDDYLRAIELNPSWADTYPWYSLYLSAMGRQDSAVAVAELAVRLDFLSPNMTTGLARAHFYAGDFEQALASATRAFELDSTFTEALLWQTAALLGTGAREQALALLQAAETHAAASPPAPLYQALLAYGFAAAREPDHARAILARLPASPEAVETYVSPFWMAVAYAHLGETDLAFEWLSAAYEWRDEFMVLLGVSPFIEPLRGDPRYSAIEDSMSVFIGR